MTSKPRKTAYFAKSYWMLVKIVRVIGWAIPMFPVGLLLLYLAIRIGFEKFLENWVLYALASISLLISALALRWGLRAFGVYRALNSRPLLVLNRSGVNVLHLVVHDKNQGHSLATLNAENLSSILVPSSFGDGTGQVSRENLHYVCIPWEGFASVTIGKPNRLVSDLLIVGFLDPDEETMKCTVNYYDWQIWPSVTTIRDNIDYFVENPSARQQLNDDLPGPLATLD